MKFQITESAVTVIHNGNPVSVAKGQPNFKPLVEALFREDWGAVEKLLTVKKQMEAWSNGAFMEKNGQIFHEEEALPDPLARQILGALRNGTPPDRYLRFWERLANNPSYRSVAQLFTFLSHQGILISPNGTFIAYKGVSRDAKDKYTGRFDNSPGQVLQMERRRVSDDPRTACHFGFHVGAWEYARDFGEQVVACEVDPADVVCVPEDRGQQKMRVCKYKVIGFVAAPLTNDPLDAQDVPSVEAPDASASFDSEALHTDNSPVAIGETVPSKQVALQVPLLTGDYASYNLKDASALFAESLDSLRRYASQNLLIVGASKLPGGKATLVDLIVQKRGYMLAQDAPAHIRNGEGQ